MSSEFNSTCLAKENVFSTDFNKTIAGLLLIFLFGTVLVLISLLCFYKRKSAQIRSRANLLTYTSIFGSLLQSIWAIDVLMDRKGVLCLIIENLPYCLITFVIVPILIQSFQIYFQHRLNQQLAKFDLISTMAMRGYDGLEDGEAKDCTGRFARMCCNFLFSKSRKKRALRQTLTISEKLIGVTKQPEGSIAMDHFPSEHVFFLASKHFSVKLQLTAFILTMIIIGAKIDEESFCTSPCRLDDAVMVQTLVIAILIVPLPVYFLFKVRNAPDPLGFVKELFTTLTVGSCSGIPGAILIFTEPGNIQEEGSFSWSLIWVYGIWVHLILMLGVPLYKARKQEMNRKNGVLGVSLSTVLGSEVGRDLFKAFTAEELSVENYMFWESAKKYKDRFMQRNEIENAGLRKMISDLYIGEDSQLAVNISGYVAQGVKQKLNDDPSPTDFDEAMREVLSNMEYDSFLRFRETKEFKRIFSEEAQNI